VSERTLHRPTELEVAFLRTITRGYPELEAQIESCELSDYDPVGYYAVHVSESSSVPASLAERPVQGPAINFDKLPQPKIVMIGEPTVFLVAKHGASQRVPYTEPAEPKIGMVEILFWTDDDGMLASIEVVSYGDGYIADPCSVFVNAANAVPPLLKYASQRK
jgi:hypothetical protein